MNNTLSEQDVTELGIAYLRLRMMPITEQTRNVAQNITRVLGYPKDYIEAIFREKPVAKLDPKSPPYGPEPRVTEDEAFEIYQRSLYGESAIAIAEDHPQLGNNERRKEEDRRVATERTNAISDIVRQIKTARA
jgi:hypothetical protein